VIIFHNPGLIPLDVFRLRGVSVKQAGSFGRFGTGFSYAIATILRGGGSVRIWRGANEVRFECREVTVKDQAFEEVVLVNPAAEKVEDTFTPLGFTTSLGKDWEPWMALRELACNARDEGGDFKVTDMPAVPDCFSAKDDETVIVVEWPEMDQAAREDGEHVFVPEGEVLLDERGVRVLQGPSDYLYHRGVRVWKLPKPSVFTYDITAPVDLTEDRTVKYGFCVVANVRNMILQTEDRSIIAAAVTAKKDTWERGFDWTGAEWSAVPPGATWLDEVAALREKRVNNYSAPELSESASKVMLNHRAFKEVHHSSSWSSFEGEARSLNYASDILDDLGMGLGEGTNGIPVFITKMLPGDALSAVNEGRVFLAERLLEERTSVIVRELLRRQLELKSGGDHDALLDFALDRLFDLATKQDSSLRRDWALAEEEADTAPPASAPAEEPPAAPAASLPAYDYTEDTCPGHVASTADAKVCGRCGTHVDSLRPDDLDDDLPF
jgi:hypothetical protein